MTDNKEREAWKEERAFLNEENKRKERKESWDGESKPRRTLSEKYTFALVFVSKEECHKQTQSVGERDM